MQGIYTYIPETSYVLGEYSVADILLLLFMVLISLLSVLNLLHFYISTFRSKCAVPNMAVFWTSLTACFPGMLLAYFIIILNILHVIVNFIKIVYHTNRELPVSVYSRNVKAITKRTLFCRPFVPLD